ncbi:uncharacterized protein LOC141720905 isoform X2 [Apium graveolens]|uniref:uncharacterized protein LOC141720905 isoform X2 n=1 Tax=Apium graveolens TaxID=4045 RepID=UPI003D796978
MMNNMDGHKGRIRTHKCVAKEEWCFYAMLGDFFYFMTRNCIKVCHPKCIGKDDSVVNTGNSWTCDAHSCIICHKGQDFICVGCPKALCRHCIGQVEFVQIGGNKGLCHVCLKYGLLVEEKKDGDYDRKFMEHFRLAWKIIRERESLTLKYLHSAEDRMKKGEFYMSCCDSDENDGVKSDIYDKFPKENLEARKIPPLQIWTYNGENDPEVLLHVSGMENKISINLLENCNITQEECKDLKIRIQRGILKQPTVDELEQKAIILHEDTTKHWIATELQRLKNRFDLACEKGWRGQMIEFGKKRDLLLKSDEQAKLLNTVPHVVAAAEGELELLFRNCLKAPATSGSRSGKLAEDNRPPMEEEAEAILQTGGDQVIHNPSASLERTQSIIIGPGNDEAIGHEKTEGSTAKEVTEEDQVVLDLSKSSEMLETVTTGLVDDHVVEQEKIEGSTAQITVSNDVKDNGRPSVPVDHQDLKWNIITPAGAVSGPYQIDDLKCVTKVLPFY